jgi:hypothetical protein
MAKKAPSKNSQKVEVVSSKLSYEGPLFRVHTDQIKEDARRDSPQRIRGGPGGG